ncbi:hypothetical protein [Flavobacterium luteum]|uniref:Uncharacterized protein n=1 Tax=Flavobacterium luteum TaxID=2026654 RepID=A0A7J5AK18_9FLAO|nr:hypothetical protein [Flavobacterium luteum]KAB1157957.1 hypothetical protein F6464_02415 [Flavobacterium luteum]
MEIVIHGTKGGRKIFTSNKLSGLFDVTSDSPKTSAIGQSAYAIRFISNSTIFSKYKIIRDVRGDKRTGFIAFSIFLSKNEKLSGSEIIALLDKVSGEYCQKYIIENNLNEVNEDWTFLELLSNEYKNKIGKVSIEESENIQSGDLDDAFIYFFNNSELHKYFDQPNQEEYIPYRQVYLINKEFKDKSENPLNAIRNSGVDLTGQIDLENPSYKLREFHGNAKNGVSITIKNSKGRQLNNKDKIFRKDELTVVYSKKNYKEKKIFGSLLNSEEIRNFLNVSTDNKIDVFKEVELESEVKTFSFEVVKKDGSRVMDAVITCKNNYQPEKQALNNQVDFSGEDLNEKWSASAKIGDNFFSNSHIIDFEKDSLSPIKLILNEKRKVKIIAIQEEEPKEPIYNFKVWIQGRGYSNENEIEFEENELNISYNINVKSDGYEDSEVKSYHPLNDGNKSLYFHLKKPDTSIGSKYKNNIENEIDLVSNENEDYTIWYQKPKFIIFSVVSVLILSIGIWGLSHYVGKQENPEEKITAEIINEYLEGDALILSKLITYKANWEMQNPQNNTNDEGFWSSIFHNDENQNSFEETDNWNQISDSIVSAITKRELIDKKDFEKLREEVHFNNQESFEKTIHNLSKTKCKLLKEKLKDIDISSLSLPEIESKIKGIIDGQESKQSSTDLPFDQGSKSPPKDTGQKQSSEGVTTVIAGKKDNKGPQKTGENTIGTSERKAHTDNDGNSASPSSDISLEIKKYLKGDEIKKIKLEEYKNTVSDPKIKESILIALKLWELDGKDPKKKKDYLNQIENNRYLIDSKLNQFVKKIINKDETIKKNNMKTLKEISNENN